MRVSMEVDLYPKNRPERWELIDGSIGEGSPFHTTYGYYAQGVDETTAVLPRGWKDRLIAVRNSNTRGVTGWCLEPHDLVLSKCVAGREKDVRFLKDALAAKIVTSSALEERIKDMAVDEAIERVLIQRVTTAASGS